MKEQDMKEQFIMSRGAARAIAALPLSERWGATSYAFHYGLGDVTVSDNRMYDDITREIDRANKITNRASAEDIKEIVAYLNKKCETQYRVTTDKTRKLINARFVEKYKREDFYKVIDCMAAEWKGGKYERFLRPETLFGNKFESYLNHAKLCEERGSFDTDEYFAAAMTKTYGEGVTI